ncbi:biotin/lipoyl-containing protein, partial [Pseudonocardia aurantiaca]|uniref:biotin/lipoyl-containing protein n=1 Tax=Pseudonocardia aurantiaca TaxID=75290 RepID=UPI0031E3392C
MAFSVQMPALGESVTEGTVTRWLKKEGDRVEVDEPLLEVSTDKVDTEIPSPAAGVLQRIVAGEDEIVEVGGELALIGDESGAVSDSGGDVETSRASSSAVQAPAKAEADAQARVAPPSQSATSQSAPSQAAPSQADEPVEAPRAATRSTVSGTAVTMPELGESVTEGTVTRWLKQVGDDVAVDEPLLEVSTDKVDTEIPSPIAGTLLEITAGEDETVEVGGQLAVIGDASDVPAEEPAAPPARQQSAPAQQQAPREPVEESAASNGKVEQAERASVAAEQPERPEGDEGGADQAQGAPYVTPLVRKLAAENDVDLTTIAGSGVGGRIRKQDVLAAAEARKPAPAPEPEPAPAAAPAAAPALAACAGGSDTGGGGGATTH